eukprot:TRINITY_DN4912_c0_g1_i1.p1 TRINITY_DN4912_c0_g1~~TRINITY_DN4912_c0_g1_i1.p1  ORF type:complete len:432 (-),score=53.79 TRINITY_DN4912_c0_g1_i1:23-1318(-)
MSISFFVCLFLLSTIILSSSSIVIISAHPGCTEGTPSFSNSYSGDDPDSPHSSGEILISWTIDCVKATFNVTIRAKATGWVAMAIGDSGSMYPSDITMGWVTVNHDGGDNHNETYQTVTVRDKFATANKAPKDDTQLDPPGTDDILQGSVSGSEIDGVTTISFSRRLVSNDVLYDRSLPPTDVHLLWAFNSGSDDPTEQHTSHGGVLINFYSGRPALQVDIRLMHGLVMLLMWGLLVPQATFIAAYMKAIGHWWYRLHMGIQVIVILGTSLAFFSIVSVMMGGRQFHSVHHLFGLFIFILVLIQGFLGWLANRRWDPSRTKVPLFPDQLHWWLGRTLELSGYINIFLGFNQIGIKQASVYVLMALWVLLTYVVSGALRWFTNPLRAGSAQTYEWLTTQSRTSKTRFIAILFGAPCGLGVNIISICANHVRE